MQIYFLVLYFFVYGFLGWCTEVAFAAFKERRFVNRGFLSGPFCPIYGVGVSAVIFLLEPLSQNLLLLYIASTILVTVLEGLTGYFMEKIFRHKWWDYSDQPLNIGGYVCLLFSLVWGVACVLIMKVIHPFIHKGLALLPLGVGIVVAVVVGIYLSADLYVTAAGILKLNRQLDKLEKLTGELRELSDRLGETIYENVMDTVEFGEERQKRLEELHKYYEELVSQRTKVSRRLINAFPKMQSRHHRAILEELKKKMKM